MKCLLNDQKAVDLGFGQSRIQQQVGIHLGDAVCDQPIHFLARSEVGVAGVGNVLLVRPSADGNGVDVDKGADLVSTLAKYHHLLDEGQKFQLVLN